MEIFVNNREENIDTMECHLSSILCAIQLKVLSGRNGAVSDLKPSYITAQGSQKTNRVISYPNLFMHNLFQKKRRVVLC